jgi:hypothetical protein
MKLSNPEAFVRVVRFRFDIGIDIEIAGHDRAGEEYIEKWPFLNAQGQWEKLLHNGWNIISK